MENHKIEYWNIINLAEEVLDNQLRCCVTRRGTVCNKFAIKKIIIDDKTLGFCNLKTCQKELNSTYNKKKIKKNKLLTTKDIPLDTLGKILYKKLEKLDIFKDLDTIVIENQPVLKNPTMKSVQMLVYSYLLYKGAREDIPFTLKLFNAIKKLKIYDGPKIDTAHIKDSYKKRKYLSEKYCLYFLEKCNKDYMDMFKTSKKRDDLSDCYLQALTYYYK